MQENKPDDNQENQQAEIPDPYKGPGPKKAQPINWKDIFPFKKVAHIPPDPFSQLVVFPKSNATQADIQAWAKKKFNDAEVFVIAICGTCDSSLVLLEGEGIKILLEGDPVAGGSKGQGGVIRMDGQSSDGPVYVSPNFGVRVPYADVKENFKKEGIEPFEATNYKYKENVIDVAVLDSGLEDKVMDGYLYKGQNNPCILNAKDGWDFVGDDPKFDDNHIYRHGTAVSGFIIQQAIKYHNNPVRILPIKVSNRNGESDLYDVLCAIAYAKERGAKIINASFGFYASRPCGLEEKQNYSQSVFLFKKFIRKYLKDDLILVAAAGNRDRSFFDPYFRDLDHISFFPASFARTSKNVFAVTTVDEDEVCPTQNFSPYVVDAGVYADTTEFQFFHPFNNAVLLKGSSFAAPILAGKIAANYSLIKEKLGRKKFTKKNILRVLREDLLLGETNDDLDGQIKNGFAVRKIEP